MAKPRKKGGKWYVRFKDELGVWRELSVGARTAAEAKLLGEELSAKARNSRLGLTSSMTPPTVNEVWETYQRVASTESGWKSKRSRFKLDILPAFGARRLHQVTPADVEELMAAVQKPPRSLSAQSADHVRVAIASLYTYAIERKKLYSGSNPGLEARKADIPQRPPRFLELHHLVAVLEHVEPELRNLFAISALTGLRLGELKPLTVRDVDLTRRLIVVWKSNARQVTKGRKLRVVPVSSDAVPFLEAALKQAKSEWLFSDERGRQLPAWKSFVKPLRRALIKAGLVEGYDLKCRREDCGYMERSKEAEQGKRCPRCGFTLWAVAVPVPFVFHNLRSTAATHHYDATGDIRFVQALLGHQDTSTTERYAAMRPDRMVALSDRLKLPQPVPNHSMTTGGIGQNEQD